MTAPPSPRHPLQELRNQMIGCFFKSLTVRSEAVVAVARDALASVIAQSKLQKELLQSSLRPILLNLADYRKLSVPLLQVRGGAGGVGVGGGKES